MTAKNNLQVSVADFDQIKSSLKTYLKINSGLNDVDFEGSGASVLLDILAYNTFYNNVYLNAASNEMFIRTAVQRTNVVAHATTLGYTPQSYLSSNVTGVITITPSVTATEKYLTIPKNTIFLTNLENKSYKYQTLEPFVLELSNNTYTGTITLYEGTIYNYTYSVDLSDLDQKFKIPYEEVDISHIDVGVIRDSVYTEYERVFAITQVNATSKVYWIKEGDDGLYEVIFGDGVLGEGLSQGDIVVIEPLVCNGAITNGATDFECQTSIGGYSNVVFTSDSPSHSGSSYEDIESIRKNAVPFFETQNRSVTWLDYEVLLNQQFPYLESVLIWGGEENDPPYYGRVFICAKPTGKEILSEYEKNEITTFLKTKNMVSVFVEYKDPEYLYLVVDSSISFDYINSTYAIEEVPQLVKDSILDYVDTNFEKFGKTFKNSNFITYIDNSVIGINSNISTIKVKKRTTPFYDALPKYSIPFGITLSVETISSNGFKVAALASSYIYLYSDTTSPSNGLYNIYGYTFINSVRVDLDYIFGTISYETGDIIFNYVNITELEDDDIYLEITANPLIKDISVSKNNILTIVESDITIDVYQETLK